MSEVYVFYPPAHDCARQAADQQPSQMPAISTALASPPTALRQLLLLPELQSVCIPGYTDGFRIRLTATNAVNVDPFIFLYVATPLQPGSANYNAKFQKVCSPSELIACPAGAPWPSFNPPNYRLDYVELDFHTRGEALFTRDALIGDANQLITSLNTMDILIPETPILVQGY